MLLKPICRKYPIYDQYIQGNILIDNSRFQHRELYRQDKSLPHVVHVTVTSDS
uniref:Uncharacterized protein n=1 Tax=Rhizophora mucronata TaxID=61149 RepID=A0A2P2LHX9_RHIMU